MRLAFTLVVFSLLLCITSRFSRAEDTSALINHALDKSVTFQIDGVVPQVFKKIEDQTAVPIQVQQAVYDLLPWGEQTNVGVKIQNKTLRDALTNICNTLGLAWDVGAQAVVVKPSPPLARLGRRATVDELNALSLLAQKPMNLA